jgi:hypothetical protein
MNTTVKRLALCSLFLMMLGWGLLVPGSSHAQDTGSLETECLALATAGSFVVPAPLTAQEFCHVMVAVLGEEWSKAAKLEATIIVVNDHDVRLAAAEAIITQLQAEIAALQAQGSVQPQIDAINVKLADVAAILQ